MPAQLLLASTLALSIAQNAKPSEVTLAPGVVEATRFSAALGPERSASLGALSLFGARTFVVPERGFYIATLVSGDVETVIREEKVVRHPGDSWVVPAGATMAVSLLGHAQSTVMHT